MKRKPTKKSGKKKPEKTIKKTRFQKWEALFSWPKGVSLEQRVLIHKLFQSSETLRKKAYKGLRRLEQSDARRIMPFILSMEILKFQTKAAAARALADKAGHHFASQAISEFVIKKIHFWKEFTPFYRTLAEIGDKTAIKPLVESMLYRHGNWENVGIAFYRQKLGNYLEALAFRMLPKGNKGRLRLLKRFCKPLVTQESFDGPLKIDLLQIAVATDPKLLKNMPSNLKDPKQRRKIDYLHSLRQSLSNRSVKEVAETLKLIKAGKK